MRSIYPGLLIKRLIIKFIPDLYSFKMLLYLFFLLSILAFKLSLVKFVKQINFIFNSFL